MSTVQDDRKLDGKSVSNEILADIKKEVESLKSNNKPVPGLSVILVGDRGDSSTYVRMKSKACEDVGFRFNLLKFDVDIDQETLINESMCCI